MYVKGLFVSYLFQTKLVNVAESISNKLSYFTELDRVGSRLNSSTLSVTSDSFVATLARLDECISFIGKHVSAAVELECMYVVYTYKNMYIRCACVQSCSLKTCTHHNVFFQPHYKESQVYLARFKQYLSRALNLVKQHVVNTLKATTKSVLPKQDKPVSQVAQYIQSRWNDAGVVLDYFVHCISLEHPNWF